MMRGIVINGADPPMRLASTVVPGGGRGRKRVGLAATPRTASAWLDQHGSSDCGDRLRGDPGGAWLVGSYPGRQLAAWPGLGTSRRIHVPHDARGTRAIR